MKKLVIISLDLMLALPIVSAAFVLLFSCIESSQSYLLASATLQSRELNAFDVSQTIAQEIDSNSINYSSALQLADSYVPQEFAAKLVAPGMAGACNPQFAVCRLVTVSGSVYLLVVSYENSS